VYKRQVYKGFQKGLILELAMLVGLIVGLYAGYHFSSWMAAWIKGNFNVQGEYIPLLSFILVFILVLLGMYILGKLIEKTAEALMMGFLNKLGGAVFGALKMAVILSFVIFILNWVSPSGQVFSKAQQEKSFLYKSVSSIAPLLVPKAGKIKSIFT
jgi:membrane protein required for colicin V production